MRAIEMLAEDDRPFPTPDWSVVAAALERVAAGASLTLLLESAGGAWLSVSHAESYGVQVMAMEDGELGEKVLTDPSAPPKLVDVTLGGLPQTEVASTLVGAQAAFEAARHFYRTLRRSTELRWEDPIAVEKAVRSAL